MQVPPPQPDEEAKRLEAAEAASNFKSEILRKLQEAPAEEPWSCGAMGIEHEETFGNLVFLENNAHTPNDWNFWHVVMCEEKNAENPYKNFAFTAPLLNHFTTAELDDIWMKCFANIDPKYIKSDLFILEKELEFAYDPDSPECQPYDQEQPHPLVVTINDILSYIQKRLRGNNTLH